MYKKTKIKFLTPQFNYYSEIKIKSDKIAEKVYGNYDEIFKARLYNLVLNLCNQLVYDYTYVFTKRDLYFIADYNINVYKLLDEFKPEVITMKKRIKK